MKTSDKQRTVGIVVAMQHEFDAMREILMPEASIEVHQNSRNATAVADGANYVMVQSGVGTTNAAIGTCDLLHRYSADLVLNLGTTALISDPSRSLQVVDVLVGEQHYQWDLDIGGPITPEWGKKRSWVDVLQTDCLYPDTNLYGLANRLGKFSDFRLAQTRFFSGNSFFSSDVQHSFLPAAANTPVAVDMESFAVAQVCARKGIPFLCLRGITDTGTANANQDFYANVRAASRAAARAAQRLVQLMLSKEESVHAEV